METTLIARRTSYTQSRMLVVFGLLIAFSVCWFYVSGFRTLVPTDEVRYAEIAREMAFTGDFITPRLNGIKYFEKPPLQYWMNALSFKAFGIGEWQARLWTSLCGIGGILLVAYTGGRLYGRSIGISAAFVLGSSFYWALAGHINSLDMGLSAMLTLSLCGLLIAQHAGTKEEHRHKWMLACWAGMALAVLSKGLIGLVLPGATLIIYSVWARDRVIWSRLHFRTGLVVFCVITLPWLVLVSLKNPEFPHFFFIHEHFQRFTSNVHRRGGSWGYFVPFLLLGSLPWLALLPGCLWNAMHEKAKGFQPKKLLLAWIAFTFLFFSLSGSKLPGYILPIFPAQAFLLALHLEQATKKEIAAAAGLFGLLCAIGLVIAWRLPSFAKHAYMVPLYGSFGIWVAASAFIGLIGSIVAVATASRQRAQAVFALAISAFLCSQGLLLGYEGIGRYKAGKDHVEAIKSELSSSTPIYSVGHYAHAMPFYLQRTLILVGEADEMAYGLSLEPNLWVPTTDAFVADWIKHRKEGQRAIAILRPQLYAELQTKGVPMRIIAQDGMRVIVANDNGK